jgi:hypothetical protein
VQRVQHDEAGEGEQEPGQQGRPPRARRVHDQALRAHRPGDAGHHHDEQADAEQLDDHRRVGRRRPEQLGRTHHLRHVVDRGAEEEAGLRRRPAELPGQERIDQHRHGRQRRDAHHHQQREALLLAAARQQGRDRQRGRGAADRGGAAGDQALRQRQAQPARQPGAAGDRAGHRGQHQQRGRPAECHDLLGADARAEQRDTQAQHEAAAKFDARGGLPLAADAVHRHAEQQRVEHRRAVVQPGDEAGRQRDHAAQHHARQQLRQRGDRDALFGGAPDAAFCAAGHGATTSRRTRAR